MGHRRNQLFGYIHYLTEINVNLLLKTCNFHRKFRLIFSSIEELGAKTASVTIFSDFLKYWEILGFFHSCTVF